MAARSQFTVQVDGLNELNRNLRQLRDRDLNRKVREVNKQAAEVVKPEAKRTAPVGHRDAKSARRYRPGKLERSITVQASVKGARIKAGSAARVPYAGAIHFGWPAHHVRPNRFLYRAMARKSDEVSETYEREISSVLRERLESE
jgi:HK97 gp10 family phage protein